MTSNTVRLSVALVTRNRPESLALCLASLRSQSVQPFEIVVSDDSDPATAHESRGVSERWDCRYVLGPRRGLYANRNHAALACDGTHIRTMDDDHRFPEGHMRQCLDAVQDDRQAIWTTGEILYVDGDYHGTAKTANQLHPSGVGGPLQDLDNNWAIADGSTIYPRTVFDHGYRMVEEFTYGSSYLEFGVYLYSRGFRSRCIPGAYVEHHAGRDTLTRFRSTAYTKSILYSMFCFNLHFRPNKLLAGRYLLPHLKRLDRCAELLAYLPALKMKVSKRWEFSQ